MRSASIAVTSYKPSVSACRSTSSCQGSSQVLAPTRSARRNRRISAKQRIRDIGPPKVVRHRSAPSCREAVVPGRTLTARLRPASIDQAGGRPGEGPSGGRSAGFAGRRSSAQAKPSTKISTGTIQTISSPMVGGVRPWAIASPAAKGLR